MKILTLSDFHWHSASKEINLQDIHAYLDSGEILTEFKFLFVKHYISIVEKEKPKLILLAGDLTGDGSCGHGFHNACSMLMLYFEQNAIPCLFIKGDHDQDKYYKILLSRTKKLQFVNEISGKTCRISDINILGLSYDHCNSKSYIQKVIDSDITPVDIVLSHASLKRRTHLFDIPSQLLITGHFDNKLLTASGKIFISHNNDTDIINYSMIEYSNTKIGVSYNFLHPKRKLSVYYTTIFQTSNKSFSKEKLIVNRKRSDIAEYEKLPLLRTRKENVKYQIAYALKFLRSSNYSAAIELMHALKNKLTEKNTKALIALLDDKITPFNKLSVTMIKDYLGSSFLTKKKKKSTKSIV